MERPASVYNIVHVFEIILTEQGPTDHGAPGWILRTGHEPRGLIYGRAFNCFVRSSDARLCSLLFQPTGLQLGNKGELRSVGGRESGQAHPAVPVPPRGLDSEVAAGRGQCEWCWQLCCPCPLVPRGPARSPVPLDKHPLPNPSHSSLLTIVLASFSIFLPKNVTLKSNIYESPCV